MYERDTTSSTRRRRSREEAVRSPRSSREVRGGSSSRRASSRGGASVRGAGSGQRRRRPPQGAPRRSRGLVVPLIPAVLALVLAVVTSVMLTRCVMQPRIDAAQKETKEARKEATSLRNEVDRLKEEAEAAKSTASTTGVDSPWTSTGKFTSGDDTLDKEVKDFCDSNCSTDQTREDAALAMYTALAWSDYVERDAAQHPSGADWRIRFAKMYYENDCSGNCYEFAAFLMYCMRYMGYDDALCQGVEIEFEGGNWGDHGIVFVTNTDGSECLLDTARGVDGWMLGLGVYNYRIMDFENA